MSLAKESYRAYCRTHRVPLFVQDWWLDAVCVGKEWDVLSTEDWYLPILLRKRLGMRFVVMPQQTQLTYLLAKDGDRPIATAADVARQIDQLGLTYYYQHYPIDSELAQHMTAYGYSIKPHTTYRIENLSDMAAIRKGYSDNKRRQLKKAAGLRVDYSMKSYDFYAFHSRCLEEQQKKISYSPILFDALYRACQEHGCGQIIRIMDGDKTCAAVFLAYDQDVCYYLIPTYAKAYAHSGAGARLVDEAIQCAAEHSRVFDFEGSMIPGVANHYRQFGSIARTFYEVEKARNPIILALIAWLKSK